ncbi:MAG TPA: DUF58 domain-containing protein [Solirubrobacteraceae bacterium]|nr:DUF58 domain-containing protein [Solirubrobacteraceae bacterium]
MTGAAARPRVSARRAAATAAAGAGMLVIALAFDASPLFVPALGLLIAGALAPVWVWTSARGARVSRELVADRVIEDAPLTATLVVRRGRLGLPGAEVADPFTGARLELSGPLSPFTGDREARVRVVSHFARRGAYTLAAPVLHVADPLELARVTRSGDGPAQAILVLPRTFPVTWLAGGGHRRLAHSEGDAATEAFAAVDLDGLRPYRPGTPASRIHWPAVARGAGLIERRLSADTDTRPLVVLDTRGRVAASEVDAAVRAAASIALELARRGGCGLLLPGEQRATAIERDLAAWPAVYARLATVPGGPQARPPVLAAGGGRAGAMIYVAARAPERLLREPGRGGRVVLVVPTAGLRGGRPAGVRGGARAVLEVAGCRGFELGARRERVTGARVAGSAP